MRRSEFTLRPLIVLMLVGLAGCASQKKTLPGDDEPTLASLAGRRDVTVNVMQAGQRVGTKQFAMSAR